MVSRGVSLTKVGDAVVEGCAGEEHRALCLLADKQASDPKRREGITEVVHLIDDHSQPWQHGIRVRLRLHRYDTRGRTRVRRSAPPLARSTAARSPTSRTRGRCCRRLARLLRLSPTVLLEVVHVFQHCHRPRLRERSERRNEGRRVLEKAAHLAHDPVLGGEHHARIGSTAQLRLGRVLPRKLVELCGVAGREIVPFALYFQGRRERGKEAGCGLFAGRTSPRNVSIWFCSNPAASR